MRGDPPYVAVPGSPLVQSTPHARGSTAAQRLEAEAKRVYPACAGIHPVNGSSGSNSPRLPRMRGDPPLQQFCPLHFWESTPHARGSTS